MAPGCIGNRCSSVLDGRVPWERAADGTRRRDLPEATRETQQ